MKIPFDCKLKVVMYIKPLEYGTQAQDANLNSIFIINCLENILVIINLL